MLRTSLLIWQPKKVDLESNSDELNATIAAIKAQVASINSFLDSIQKQIIDANSKFTTGQQAKISQSIADGQKKLADSIASMQSKFETDSKNLKSQGAQVIADLKNSSNSAITEMQNNQSTAMAKVNKDITDTEAIIKKSQNISGVRTNLYKDTRDFDNPDVWTNWVNWTKTGDKFNGLTVMTTGGNWNGLFQTIQAKKDEVYTFSVYARYKSGTGTSSLVSSSLENPDDANPHSLKVSLDTTWKRVSLTATLTTDGLLNFRIERSSDNTNTLLIAGPKLEKGPIATDYSLNPLDYLSSEDVQTEIAKQIKANQPDLSGFQNASDVQTAISNALSDVNAKVKELETKVDKLSQGK